MSIPLQPPAQIPPGLTLDDQELAPIAATRERYRPELDGIRAICIIFTIFNHIPNCPWFIDGVAGVDVFFPLSGWLITALLVREYQESGSISLKSFWIRRIFRIMPLYYVTVAIYIVLIVNGMKDGAAEQLRNGFVYMVTMNMEYRPFSAGSLFGHAWTLGIEEKFYLVWPLILAGFQRTPAMAGVVAIAVLGVLGVSFGMGGTFLLGYTGLAVGSGLSLLCLTNSKCKQLITSRRTRAIALLVMALCYISCIYTQYALISNLLLAISAAFVIGSLWFVAKARLARFLSLSPLPWLGRLTYALYLIQSLCVRFAVETLRLLKLNLGVFAIFIIAYVVSIAAAFIMHRIVELPMMRLGKSLARRFALNTAPRDMSGGQTA